jgi:hypothetical protein
MRNTLAHGARKVARRYFSEEAAKEKLENLIKHLL